MYCVVIYLVIMNNVFFLDEEGLVLLIKKYFIFFL